MRRSWIAAGLLLLGLSSAVYAAPSSQAGLSPQVLLQRMDRAVKRQNYSGTFVYQNGNALSTMKVVHAWQAGQVRERLISQNGSRREVLIDGNSVTYVRPSIKSIVIIKRSARPELPGSVGGIPAWKSPYYRLQLGGVRRIAGMRCRQVSLQPKDQLRYARRFCIGLNHYLPLESEVIDRHGGVIERMLFTSLKMLDSVPASTFAPPRLSAGYTIKRLGNTQSKPVTAWRFTALPSGFKLFASLERHVGRQGRAVNQLVLSDGVSTMSVFISPRSADITGGQFLRSGAINVYVTLVHGHDVTVMGEVPKQTLRDVVAGLSYRG